LSNYEGKVAQYDEGAFPSEYKSTFSNEFALAEVITREAISKGWRVWVTQKDNEELDSLKSALETLSKDTPIGNDRQWDIGASAIKVTHISEYNKLIDTNYTWKDGNTVKTNFSNKVDTNVALSKSEFQQNLETIKELIKLKLGKFHDLRQTSI
jgi:hypothetical protein